MSNHRDCAPPAQQPFMAAGCGASASVSGWTASSRSGKLPRCRSSRLTTGSSGQVERPSGHQFNFKGRPAIQLQVQTSSSTSRAAVSNRASNQFGTACTTSSGLITVWYTLKAQNHIFFPALLSGGISMRSCQPAMGAARGLIPLCVLQGCYTDLETGSKARGDDKSGCSRGSGGTPGRAEVSGVSPPPFRGGTYTHAALTLRTHHKGSRTLFHAHPHSTCGGARRCRRALPCGLVDGAWRARSCLV